MEAALATDTRNMALSGGRVEAVTDTLTVVAGLGASGLATARYLAARGEDVLVIDSRAAPPGLGTLQSELPDVRVELGTLDPRWLKHARQLVIAPGLPVDLPIVVAAREHGVEVVGELELFARVAPAPVIAVTGSNGKSTVVTLLKEILAARGFRVLAGGNLGPPALELLAEATPDFYVIEVSSFQPETTESLTPRAAAVLNVSADHLDRHGSMDAYAAIKSQLLLAGQTAVYNADDPLVARMIIGHRDAVPFSIAAPLAQGWSIAEGPAADAVTGTDGATETTNATGRWICRDGRPLMPCSALALGGAIGEANALAALALAEPFGGDVEAGLAALRDFRSLPHRMSSIATVGGIDFIDDSKATNVGAACAALDSIRGSVVLIAGGRGKGADFAPLAKAASGRVRAVVLIGESADALERALADLATIRRADSIEAAVSVAADLAEPGDTVLLSPACASQDMFVDYRQRGDRFANAVRGLSA